ncbi:MAG: ChaN family lipoprotein [Alkalinema sp. RU_4_3]|nr:ChaN family lipoprotein [Alkalinema sp. RU_4_3]
MKPATKFFPIFLALLCWLGHPAYAAPSLTEPEVTRSGQLIKLPQVWADLQSAQVLYLGETHDQEADHQAQRAILETLLTGEKPLTLAMEMFQRPYQGAIDRYFKGELTEAEFLAQTEYLKRWGFPWALYAPIVNLAKDKNIPLIALNTPSEVTRQVARKGLDILTPEQRQFIPETKDIFLGPEGYRQQIQQLYTEMHQGKGNSSGGDRFSKPRSSGTKPWLIGSPKRRPKPPIG